MMKSCLALFVLVCVAVAVNGLDNCFKKEEFDKHMEEVKAKIQKAWMPVAMKCKEEKADSTNEDIAKCCKDKLVEKMTECFKEDSKQDNTTALYCGAKKLGIQCSEDEKDFGKFKNEALGLTLDDKKKVIEDACTPCEKEKHFHICVTKNLKEKCAEIDELCKKFQHME